MLTKEEQFRLNGDNPRLRVPASGLLGRILAAVLSVTTVVLAFVFSVLIFAAVAAIAIAAGGYVWWKTHTLRRRMREQQPGGRIIEGEAIRDES
jgi:Flp pilus assembly protein TadB